MNSSVRCTNGYVTGPYCSPTRAGLLTGRQQNRFGHEFNPGGGHGLPLTETLLPQRLAAATDQYRQYLGKRVYFLFLF